MKFRNIFFSLHSFNSKRGVEKIPVKLNESSKLILLLLFLLNEKLLFNSNELELFEIPELKFNKLKLFP